MAIPTLAPYAIPQLDPTLTSPAEHWTLNPQRAALLVHDMQEYFLRAYTTSADPLRTVLSTIDQLITIADDLDIPVFYSVQPPRQHPDRRGLLQDFWGTGMTTEEDAAILPELTPLPHHHLITKWRYSAFERTDLRHTLAYAQRDQLIITGVYGHMGCKVTAVEAFMQDIQPFLISDGIADFTDRDHADTLSWVHRRCGRVLRGAECLAQLRQHRGRP